MRGLVQGTVRPVGAVEARFTGVTLVLICLLHGAAFLALKTTGDMRVRSGRLARQVAPVTAAAVVAFAIWTHVTSGSTSFLNPVELLAVLAGLAAVWLIYGHREGFAFAATTVTMAASIVAFFTGLYPNVMVSTTSTADDLTVHNTASGAYSLKVMTVVVVIFLPVVLAYQTWTYTCSASASARRTSSIHRDGAHRWPVPGSPRRRCTTSRAGELTVRESQQSNEAGLHPRRPPRGDLGLEQRRSIVLENVGTAMPAPAGAVAAVHAGVSGGRKPGSRWREPSRPAGTRCWSSPG